MGVSVVNLPPVVAQAAAAIALGLLVASGIAKLVDPSPTTGAMRAAHLPSSNLASRLLGTVEVIVAGVSLVVGGAILWMAAILYLAFAAFTFGATLKRIPVQSCGCFGREDTPPTGIHVVYNTGAFVALWSLAVTNTAPIDWTTPMTEVLLYLGFTAIGVFTSYLLLARLPQLLQLTRSP